jgi:acetolactate decarboxylase
MKHLALALLCCTFAGACGSAPPAHAGPWKGRIDIYGSMHAVMMEGQTEGKVELAALQGDPQLVGIGALEALAGEVVLLDGTAWCTRSVSLGALETRAGAEQGVRAAMLVTARVSSWAALPVRDGLPSADLEGFIAQAAREHGLERTETFPFLLEGEFRDVRAHVLNGRCPLLGEGPPATEPVRRLFPVVHGWLVGFYTGLAPGMLTHAGEKTHVHLLVKDGESIACHVDELRVGAKTVLKLPLP